MKKPLLLLVDDDRAVLESLEAELLPAFEDICRIESFDDPREALAALPRWTQEQRPIAVAIVDQKMPGMSGVELLVALREAAIHAAEGTFHPAACTRTILLTGYAGLDSAIVAKNEAAVDRYVEKPWRATALREAVTETLGHFLAASALAEHFLFREVVTEPEVRAPLHLRFEVYARTQGIEHVLPHEAETRLDVDAHDSVSRFFGLFGAGPGTARLVGILRVAGETAGPARAVIAAIVAPHAALAERFSAPRRYPFPMMTYLVDRDAVAAIVAQAQVAGE